MLGVLDLDGKFRAHCAAGGDDLKESVRWVEGLETACELSAACGAQTRVITVCDQEADVWTLFERQHQLRDQVGLLVRRNSSRLWCAVERHFFSVGANPTQQLSLRLVAIRAVYGGNDMD